LTIFIDAAFREPVRTHLLTNLIAESPEAPLILGIFGPPGEGKTFQVEKICDELGLAQHLLSPGELESENAGAPGQLLRRQYLEASSNAALGKPGVLIVNDIDTILGNWGNLVQYTVNRQVVYAQLMAFCDFPTNVAGTACRRTPIVLTGNNPSILYGPLLRPGRMRLLHWQPTAYTRAKTLVPLFPLLTHEELRYLTSKHSTKPVSFWVDVRSVIIEEHFRQAVNSIGDQELSRILRSGSQIRLRPASISMADVARVAQQLDAADITDQNYLALPATSAKS
jgi:hypothetical protein